MALILIFDKYVTRCYCIWSLKFLRTRHTNALHTCNKANQQYSHQAAHQRQAQ